MRTILTEGDASIIQDSANEIGLELKRTENENFDLLIGGSKPIVIATWRFARKNDFADKSRKAIASRLRSANVEPEAQSRRDDVLRKIESATLVISVGARPGETLPQTAMDFIYALARRGNGLVWDLEAISDASSSKLTDIRGFVAGHAARQPPPAAAVMMAEPAPIVSRAPESFVLLRDLDDDVTASEATTAGRIATERSHPGSFGPRVHDLLERLRRTRSSKPGAAERISRFSFDVARARMLVDTADVAGAAKRLYGFAVTPRDIRNADGGLVIDSSGDFDAAAMNPRSVLLVARGPIASVDVASALAGRALDVDEPFELREAGGLGRRAMALASAKLPKQAHERQTAILPMLSERARVVRLRAKSPLDRATIAALLRAARRMHAFVFDGWAFYDGAGRAFLVRDGSFDPNASGA